jgi:hypothetical protein
MPTDNDRIIIRTKKPHVPSTTVSTVSPALDAKSAARALRLRTKVKRAMK